MKDNSKMLCANTTLTELNIQAVNFWNLEVSEKIKDTGGALLTKVVAVTSQLVNEDYFPQDVTTYVLYPETLTSAPYFDVLFSQE